MDDQPRHAPDEPPVLASLVGRVRPYTPGLVLGASSRFDSSRVYSVPVQFSLGAVLVLTTGLALFFATTRAMNVQPWMDIVVAPLIFIVGGAQWLCNRVGRPDQVRVASALAGGGWFFVLSLAVGIQDGSFVATLGLPVCTVIPGLIAGYLAGGVVAGIFLSGDLFDHWLAVRAAEKQRIRRSGSASPLG